MYLVHIRFHEKFIQDLTVSIDREQLSRLANFLESSTLILMFTVSDNLGPKTDKFFGYGGYSKWVGNFLINPNLVIGSKPISNKE